MSRDRPGAGFCLIPEIRHFFPPAAAKIVVFVDFLFSVVVVDDRSSVIVACFVDSRFLGAEDTRLVQSALGDVQTFVDKDTHNTQRALLFPCVSSYHRFLLHRSIQEHYPHLCTFSVGEGSERRTVVTFAETLKNSINQGDLLLTSGLNKRQQPMESPQARPKAAKVGDETKTKKSSRKPDQQMYVPRAKRRENAAVRRAPVSETPSPEESHVSTPETTRPSSPPEIIDKRRYTGPPRHPPVPIPADRPPPPQPNPSKLPSQVILEMMQRSGVGKSDDNDSSNSPSPCSSGAIPMQLRNEGDSILDCLPRSYDEFETKELHLKLDRQLSSPVTSPVTAEPPVMLEKSPPPDQEDLEVQMINESFEETQKQCQMFEGNQLRTLFYSLPNKEVPSPPPGNNNNNKPPKSPTPTAQPKGGLTWAGWSAKSKKGQTTLGGKEEMTLDSGNCSLSQEKEVKDAADDWETLCDDEGELDPKVMMEINLALGQVSVETPKLDYLQFRPAEVQLEDDELAHVLEIYGFPLDTDTKQLQAALGEVNCAKTSLKWVDDDHALACFPDTNSALEAVDCKHPLIKLRPLSQATPQSKRKAKQFAKELLPYKERPRTSAVLARRMIEGHLGKKSELSIRDRNQERSALRQAKDLKECVLKQREQAWQGTL